ncbi:hypothetical protein V5O48_005775 [Marasmius crinis-equi]|uniref:Uncharacterized protein n=1 Tax=Marasmius crinis-equi TaxID=585013 RepID=A0ABR3FLD2_9AGAR
MSKGILYLFLTVLLLGLVVSAAPVPGGAKRSLKQLKLKRGDPSPLKRADAPAGKPSGLPTPPSPPNKRQDAAAPKPSKSWRK